MKKIIVAFFIFFAVSVFYAHPPSDVIIVYDAAKKMIKVDVKHLLLKSPVQDPKKHYIKSVSLTIDGKEVKTNTFTMQESKEEQTTTFDKLNLKKGTKVTVKAVCNISGMKSSDITIK